MGFTITNHCLPASPSESDCKFQANMYLLLRMFNMLDKLLPPFCHTMEAKGNPGDKASHRWFTCSTSLLIRAFAWAVESRISVSSVRAVTGWV